MPPSATFSSSVSSAALSFSCIRSLLRPTTHWWTQVELTATLPMCFGPQPCPSFINSLWAVCLLLLFPFTFIHRNQERPFFDGARRGHRKCWVHRPTRVTRISRVTGIVRERLLIFRGDSSIVSFCFFSLCPGWIFLLFLVGAPIMVVPVFMIFISTSTSIPAVHIHSKCLCNRKMIPDPRIQTQWWDT